MQCKGVHACLVCALLQALTRVVDTGAHLIISTIYCISMQAEQGGNVSSIRAIQINDATIAVETTTSNEITTTTDAVTDAVTTESSSNGVVQVESKLEPNTQSSDSSSNESTVHTATTAVCVDISTAHSGQQISTIKSIDASRTTATTATAATAPAAKVSTASGKSSNNSSSRTVLPQARLAVDTKKQAVVSSNTNTAQVSLRQYV
jgi:hypothetical protein